MLSETPRLPYVYLDCQATERPYPAAIEAMLPYMTTQFGNPGAVVHESGRRARQALNEAREKIATCLNASFEGTVFVSGATEANNLVFHSMQSAHGRTVVASAIEHTSVLAPLKRLNDVGVDGVICRVRETGELDIHKLATLMSQNVILVSVMFANNEIGVLQPISEVSALCRKVGALLHVDAAQAVGKVVVDFEQLGADFLTVSGHKLGGPQGIGVLLTKPALFSRLTPMLIGGGQEDGLRAGTTPVALCVGLASAIEIAVDECGARSKQSGVLRQRLISAFEKYPGFFINGSMTNRLASNLNAGFEGISASYLIRRMPEICFSIASACMTGTKQSHVLRAIGLNYERIESSFRLSMGWATTADEIAFTIQRFQEVLAEQGRVPQ